MYETYRAQQSSLQPRSRRVEKPWGWEIVWAETPYYVGKVLHIHAGKRLSLQYHDEKLETQLLLFGQALLLLEDERGRLQEIELEPGKGYTIRPFQRHRLIARSEVEIVEVSTPETGTTYRLEDDYHRPHETEAMRRARPDGGEPCVR